MSVQVTLLTPDQYREMPWRNGGGSTTEIAIEPPAAGIGTNIPFVWRLSMARVQGNGPFSYFTGYDRTLVLLEGQGVHLDFGAESAAVTLDSALAHVAFSGDWATEGRLVSGPIRDFNVMVDRKRAAAQVLPLLLVTQQSVTVELHGHTTLLYVQQGRVMMQLDSAAKEQYVNAGDTLRLDTCGQSAAARIYTDSVSAQAILVHLTLK